MDWLDIILMIIVFGVPFGLFGAVELLLRALEKQKKKEDD